MRGVLAFVVCLGFLVSCSDSSGPTDPGDPGTEDPIEDPNEDPNQDPDPDPDKDPDKDPDDDPIVVVGNWSYEALTLEGNGATCTIDEATMVVTGQDDDTFTGTATGRLTCDVDTQDWEWENRTADVENGSLNGSNLTFVFKDRDSEVERAEVEHEGTIDGDTMSGTATLTYENFVLEGRWEATRDD